MKTQDSHKLKKKKNQGKTLHRQKDYYLLKDQMMVSNF